MTMRLEPEYLVSRVVSVDVLALTCALVTNGLSLGEPLDEEGQN